MTDNYGNVEFHRGAMAYDLMVQRDWDADAAGAVVWAFHPLAYRLPNPKLEKAIRKQARKFAWACRKLDKNDQRTRVIAALNQLGAYMELAVEYGDTSQETQAHVAEWRDRGDVAVAWLEAHTDASGSPTPAETTENAPTEEESDPTSVGVRLRTEGKVNQNVDGGWLTWDDEFQCEPDATSVECGLPTEAEIDPRSVENDPLMFSCVACGAVLPALGAFCPSCGNEVGDPAIEIAPSNLHRAWLMDVFTRLGFQCEPHAERPNQFFANHETRPNYNVDLRVDQQVVGLQALWTVKYSQNDEPDLLAALNDFNRKSLWWSAYLLPDIGVCTFTLMYLSAKTSPRVVAAFLERAEGGLFPIVRETQLASFFGL